MGLLDDYGIDLDTDVEASTFDVPDGIYNFTLGLIDTYEKDGRESIRFHYDLTDDNDKSFKTTEWFGLPDDPEHPTEANKVALSRLKSRIMSFGVPDGETNKVGPDELVGAYGTLQLTSTKGKGANSTKTYQNVRNLRVDKEWLEGEAEAPAPEPVKKTRAPRAKAAPKPAPEPEDTDDTGNDLDAALAAKGITAKASGATPPAAEPQAEATEDIKARIAAKRAARMAAANTSGARTNPFGGQSDD